MNDLRRFDESLFVDYHNKYGITVPGIFHQSRAMQPQRYSDLTAGRLSDSRRVETFAIQNKKRRKRRVSQCSKGCSDAEVIDDFITRQQLCRMTGITDNTNFTCIINS
ncbi:hypothetical protein TNCV_2170111 [Trichonephila clavipes]|nr:hypothetical protein TNCV_2170111 [Trichonephila clavipes]